MRDLVSSVNTIQTDITQLKGTGNSVSSVKHTTQSSVANRLNSAEEAINNVTTRVNLVGNLLIRLDEKCEALTDEVKGMKRHKTKPNLIIRGVVETKDESIEQLAQSVKDFFKDQMSIEDEIAIKKTNRLGRPGNQDRPIMIKLKDVDDKT